MKQITTFSLKQPYMSVTTGKIIADLRKEKDWNQTEFATNNGVSREMIGKYDQGEAVPSIEADKKIADAFEIYLDYLVAEGTNASFDKKTLKRLQDTHKLDADTQENFPSLLIP